MLNQRIFGSLVIVSIRISSLMFATNSKFSSVTKRPKRFMTICNKGNSKISKANQNHRTADKEKGSRTRHRYPEDHDPILDAESGIRTTPH